MKRLFLVFISLLTFKIGLHVDAKYGNHFAENPPDEQSDGPYVYYKGNQIIASYIIENNGNKTIKTESVTIDHKNDLTLKVGTDIPGKYFEVHLKKELVNEKSE